MCAKMLKRRALVWTASACFGLALVARASATEIGAGEYKARCASCHGETGAGDGPVAGALRSRPSDLRTISKRNDGVFPERVLITVIDGRKTIRAHGNFEMPVWGRKLAKVGADDQPNRTVLAIVDYLRRLQQE